MLCFIYFSKEPYSFSEGCLNIDKLNVHTSRTTILFVHQLNWFYCLIVFKITRLKDKISTKIYQSIIFYEIIMLSTLIKNHSPNTQKLLPTIFNKNCASKLSFESQTGAYFTIRDFLLDKIVVLIKKKLKVIKKIF